MFIVYGTDYSKLSSNSVILNSLTSAEPAEGEDAAPHAPVSGIAVDIYQRYASLFWIPLFPISGKLAGFKDGDDLYTIKEQALSPEDRAKVEELKAQSGKGYHLFSGLAIIVVLISWLAISSSMDGSARKDMLTNPPVGSIIVIKEASEKVGYNNFKYARVTAVKGDSVDVLFNDYYYETNGSFTEKDGRLYVYDEKNYSTEEGITARYGKSQLIEMHDADEIPHIYPATPEN